MTYEEALEAYGYIIVSPISGSMRPLIRERIDFGYFISAAKRAPKVGDIVLYYGRNANEGKVIMHRIIGIDGEGYIIQGDGSRAAELIPIADIFGVMTCYYRGSKRRSCKNPVFRLHSALIVAVHRAVGVYRTSPSPACKTARFAWRKVLH